jgi:GcrA cell cycle regulator
MSWTDERVELLKKLWQDGLSASQIAGELGGVTRNAVIGKVHRLGLSGRGQPTSSIKRQRRTHPSGIRRARVVTVGNLALKQHLDVLPDADLQPRRNVVVPIARKLSIFQLNEHTCKWPIGDPGQEDFHFCGHDSLENLPYCEYHAGVAYQAPEPRRRPKRPEQR